MRVHAIRHVPFEGPGAIAEWAAQRGNTLTESFGFSEEFPDTSEVGLTVVMGGPMAADDHANHPWLAAEKEYLRAAIRGGGRVLGICLGAQIVAECIGGTIRRNAQPEIGWFPVELTFRGGSQHCFEQWPARFTVGHWHGDTFDLPLGVESAALSEATANQAFYTKGCNVVGLQFHLEWTEASLAELVEACGSELGSGAPYVQTAEELLGNASHYLPVSHAALFSLLDSMTEGL